VSVLHSWSIVLLGRHVPSTKLGNVGQDVYMKSKIYISLYGLLVISLLTGTLVSVLKKPDAGIFFAIAGGLFLLLVIIGFYTSISEQRRNEAEARARLQTAEKRLEHEVELERTDQALRALQMLTEQSLIDSQESEALRLKISEMLDSPEETRTPAADGGQNSPSEPKEGKQFEYVLKAELSHDDESIIRASINDNKLALSSLWEVTHSRLDLYHQIATKQARQSFLMAEAATGIGFALLIAFAVLATQNKSTAGAITTGALGAVSAGLAGYIGRTFIRSQETAAERLRAYFDQPLDFSKYLAAERLLASAGYLDSSQRETILTQIIGAVVSTRPIPQKRGMNPATGSLPSDGRLSSRGRSASSVLARASRAAYSQSGTPGR